MDEITGGVIVYNAQTEQFTVDGKAPGDSTGRVRIIIQPRPEGKSPEGGANSGGPAKCPAGAPVSLKPSAKLQTARGSGAASR